MTIQIILSKFFLKQLPFFISEAGAKFCFELLMKLLNKSCFSIHLVTWRVKRMLLAFYTSFLCFIFLQNGDRKLLCRKFFKGI